MECVIGIIIMIRIRKEDIMSKERLKSGHENFLTFFTTNISVVIVRRAATGLQNRANQIGSPWLHIKSEKKVVLHWKRILKLNLQSWDSDKMSE